VLVTPRCADPLYRRSVRVSMGTVFQVPWTRLPEERGGPWAGPRPVPMPAPPGRSRARRRGGSLDAFAAARPAQVALVLGAEGDGLSRGRWPRPTPSSRSRWPAADSLNVASAAAVALWALR
jgi:tRNA G18 (ribose-2'-O)-methylase SpoU